MIGDIVEERTSNNKHWKVSIKRVLAVVFLFLVSSFVSLVIVIPRLRFDNGDRFLQLIVDGRELSRAVRGTGTSWKSAARMLADAGINGVGVSRLSLNDLEQDKAIVIQTHARNTPFKGDTGDNIYVKVLSSGKRFSIGNSLSKVVVVEEKGDWVKIFASGAFARTAHLFWDRNAVAILQSQGIEPVHRFMNHLLSGTSAELSMVSSLPEEGLVLFDEKHALGWPDRLQETGAAFAAKKAKIGLVEFAGQIGVKELIKTASLDSVIVHSITDKEMVKFNESKFIPRWLRAVRERRVRALYMRFFPPENPPAGSGNIFERNIAYFTHVHEALTR